MATDPYTGTSTGNVMLITKGLIEARTDVDVVMLVDVVSHVIIMEGVSSVSAVCFITCLRQTQVFFCFINFIKEKRMGEDTTFYSCYNVRFLRMYHD